MLNIILSRTGRGRVENITRIDSPTGAGRGENSNTYRLIDRQPVEETQGLLNRARSRRHFLKVS
jgi:hypothetical protein